MGYNEEFQTYILPVVIFFIVCNVVGFFGNLSVIYVYSLKYPRNQYRLLVMALGFVDFAACCTTVPLETVSVWLWFDSPSTWICKARYFFVMFIGLAAIYLLFITAIYKYRRICRPFGRQVTEKMIIVLCVAGMFFAVVFGTPAAILFDINNHTVIHNNVSEEAWLCEVHRDFHGTIYPAMYRHFVAVYCITMVTTIILYVFVARTTIMHVRHMRKKRKSGSMPDVSESTLSNISQTTMSTVSPGGQDHTAKTDGNKQVVTPDSDKKQLDSNKNSSTKTADKSAPSKDTGGSKSHLSAAQIRSVLIMMIIAGTFSVTFLMGLSFGYVFALRDNDDYSGTGERVALFACYRVYFINYAMNPVVYFTLDRQFRKEVLTLFSSVSSCCRK